MKNYSENIDNLLAKYFAGEATPAEAEFVHDWKSLSEENKKYFQQMQSIFSSFPLEDFDSESAWKSIKTKVEKESSGSLISFSARNNPWMKIAASIAIMITIAASYFILVKDSPETFYVASSDALVTDTLPNGSIATLNKNSTLEFVSSDRKGEEIINLSGEAFFELAPSEKEIIVRCDELFIRDIGTAFNVKAYPGDPEIEVVVTEGEVILYTQQQTGIHVLAGESGYYNKETKLIGKNLNEAPNTLSYITQTFHFSDTPLSEVEFELNRVYKRKIRIDPEISNCKLTVSFSRENIETIAEIIAETIGLSVEKLDNEIILKGAGCEN